MIEGLKVTVTADELKALCIARANHHADRAKVYREQVKNFNAAEIEAASFTNGDPTRALQSKLEDHEDQDRELRFVSEHLKAGEEYLLDYEALKTLGITKRRY